MHIFDSVQWLALRDVYFARKKDLGEPDSDYWLRKIFRWYSHYFATPLHEVEDLPLVDVLRAWYEQAYEDMEEQDLDQLVARMSIPEAKQRELDREEDRLKSLEFEDMQDAEVQNAKIDAMHRMGDAVVTTGNALSNMIREMRAAGGKESSLVGTTRKMPSKLPPDIRMQFVDPEELERELNTDPFALFAEQQRKK